MRNWRKVGRETAENLGDMGLTGEVTVTSIVFHTKNSAHRHMASFTDELTIDAIPDIAQAFWPAISEYGRSRSVFRILIGITKTEEISDVQWRTLTITDYVEATILQAEYAIETWKQNVEYLAIMAVALDIEVKE